MANIALIIAGGTGKRTNQDIPKQFLNVLDKPVVVYTLEAFQRNPEIDEIAVVCLSGWYEMLRAYARQFGITKLMEVVEGGATSQESIRCGILALRDKAADDDIVIIHDGIRPMVSDDIISDCIEKCRMYGNGITSLPITEQIFGVTSEEYTCNYIPRETLRILQTPQAYRFRLIYDAYEKAFAEKIGISPSSYANTMMAELGEKLYFAKGSSKNIKLTTKDDIEVFKAILLTGSEDWYK